MRQHEVDIGQSVYRPISPSSSGLQLLGEIITKANAIADPFEQAFFMMVHVPYLQPFADINKRTSRLAANAPLFRANLWPLMLVDVLAYSSQTPVRYGQAAQPAASMAAVARRIFLIAVSD